MSRCNSSIITMATLKWSTYIHYYNECYQPTEQHDDGIRLCRNETEHKDVSHPAGVTLEQSLTQRPVAVQRDLLVLGAHQVVDYVRPRCAAAPVTEPKHTNMHF